jgi:hypothetical protein
MVICPMIQMCGARHLKDGEVLENGMFSLCGVCRIAVEWAGCGTLGDRLVGWECIFISEPTLETRLLEHHVE